MSLIHVESNGALEYSSSLPYERFRELYFPGCKDESEVELAHAICQRTGLDPVARQIYFLERWDSKKKRNVMTPQTSIEGFRLIAERSGQYAGQVGPWWCGVDGVWRDVWLSSEAPCAAKVGVLRHDFKEPLYAIAMWSEYHATDRNGGLTQMWKKFPSLMLSKCAEALAIRKGFPQNCMGLYTKEEMAQSERPAPENPDTVPPQVMKHVRTLALEACKVHNAGVVDQPATIDMVRSTVSVWLQSEPDLCAVTNGVPSIGDCNLDQLQRLANKFQSLLDQKVETIDSPPEQPAQQPVEDLYPDPYASDDARFAEVTE